jgi:ribosomal-protein-alanine N-acetyltransferase
MCLDDLPAVTAIDAASFPTAWPVSGYRHELAKNERATYYVLVHRPAGQLARIIGYTGYWLMGDELHLSTIAVAPRWRGRGLGELLLLQVLFDALSNRATMVTLEVRRGNEIAQSLYRKYEFAVVGERRGYYRDTGEDALLMTLELAEAPIRQQLEEHRDELWQRMGEV